jgi:hypothetical protein
MARDGAGKPGRLVPDLWIWGRGAEGAHEIGDGPKTQRRM